MGIAARRKYRQDHKSYLEKKYGDITASIYLFLNERHRRRSKNHMIVSLKNNLDAKLSELYDKAEILGIDLDFLYGDHYWQSVILLFYNQEDFNLFRLQFDEYIFNSFNFNEVHRDIKQRQKVKP